MSVGQCFSEENAYDIMYSYGNTCENSTYKTKYGRDGKIAARVFLLKMMGCFGSKCLSKANAYILKCTSQIGFEHNYVCFITSP